MHSAPSSAYWQGDETIGHHEREGAIYGEMLESQLGIPHRVWLADDGAPRASASWMLPIHFPLEGSTSDTDLRYFDRLCPQFRTLLESGGHVIVGSHPDLNQQLLLDQKRLGDDGPQTAGAHQPREGGDQVDEQDEQVAHRHILATSPTIAKLDRKGPVRRAGETSHI